MAASSSSSINSPETSVSPTDQSEETPFQAPLFLKVGFCCFLLLGLVILLESLARAFWSAWR